MFGEDGICVQSGFDRDKEEKTFRCGMKIKLAKIESSSRLQIEGIVRGYDA